MFARFNAIGRQITSELKVYRLVMKDKRTPKLAKGILWFAVGYAFLPFDIIPDFIPVLGQIDDLVVVPGLVFLALRLIPNDVVADCRKRVVDSQANKT